jgi:hypothetical protein
MLHHVAVVRTDVSKEHIASIIRVTRISELGTKLAITVNQSTVLVDIFHGFLQYFQANARIVCYGHSFLDTFPIQNSSVVLPFDVLLP